MEGSYLGSAHWGDLVGLGTIVEWRTNGGAIVESHQDERFGFSSFFSLISIVDKDVSKSKKSSLYDI